MVDLNSDTFNEPAKAQVLDDTPSVFDWEKDLWATPSYGPVDVIPAW